MDSSATGGEAPRHLPGFDYLRAAMACVVIVWHTNLLTPPRMPPGDGSFRTLISLYFLLLPVPTFFMLSSFLFCLKAKGNGKYLGLRLERLAYLYLFWGGLWFLSHRCISLRLGWGSASVPAVAPPLFGTGFWNSFGFFTSWGSGPYYFFSSLLVVTALAALAARLPRMALWVLLGLSLVFLAGISAFSVTGGSLGFLNIDPIPTNFLALSFAGPLAAHYHRKGWLDPDGERMQKVLLGAAAAFTVGVILEQSVFLLFRMDQMTHYTRPAPVLGAILLFLVALSVRRPPGRAVRFLSDHSLGMYCTHPLIMTAYGFLSGIEPKGDPVYTLTVLASSILASVALRRVFSRGLI